MKKILIVLNSTFAIALTWAFVYFLFYRLSRDFGMGMREIWIMLIPAVISGLLVIPLNAIGIFLWSRRNKQYKAIITTIKKSSGILLPVLDFFYIMLFPFFAFPVLFELSSCLFEKSRSASCSFYVFSENFFGIFVYLLVFSLISALLAKWNISQFKKDRKYLLAILIVFAGTFCLFFLMNRRPENTPVSINQDSTIGLNR
jgi:hypothetical protein